MHNQFITIPLDLPEFLISKVVHQDCRKVIFVSLSLRPDWVIQCPCCGLSKGLICHGEITQRRRVRDLDAMNYRIYLWVPVLRRWCGYCKTSFTVQYDSIGYKQKTTRRFNQHLFEMVRDTTLQYVSDQLQLPYTTVSRIYHRELAVQVDTLQAGRLNLASTTHRKVVLGIDEIAFRKGHDYHTVFHDLRLGAVLSACQHRDAASCIQHVRKDTLLRKLSPDVVVIDMWEAFLNMTRKCFPNAIVVIDHYHVVRKANEMVDSIRKEVESGLPVQQAKVLKQYHDILLMRQQYLSDKQRTRLRELLACSEELQQVYICKEEFLSIFDHAATRPAAEFLLRKWQRSHACLTQLKSAQTFRKTIERWGDMILNYFSHRYTNAAVEGMNNKIKVIKRRAYGYRNISHFHHRLIWECRQKLV